MRWFTLSAPPIVVPGHVQVTDVTGDVVCGTDQISRSGDPRTRRVVTGVVRARRVVGTWSKTTVTKSLPLVMSRLPSVPSETSQLVRTKYGAPGCRQVIASLPEEQPTALS